MRRPKLPIPELLLLTQRQLKGVQEKEKLQRYKREKLPYQQQVKGLQAKLEKLQKMQPFYVAMREQGLSEEDISIVLWSQGQEVPKSDNPERGQSRTTAAGV